LRPIQPRAWLQGKAERAVPALELATSAAFTAKVAEWRLSQLEMGTADHA